MKKQLSRMAKMAKETGRIHIVGKMSFDCNQGPTVAYRQASSIAEGYDYIVRWIYGDSAFSVTGQKISGQFIFDWFNSELMALVKIEHQQVEEIWLN